MKKVTQEQQVIEVLRRAGGYATLRRLNELVDFSSWTTKTPEASVRRIVQNSPEIDLSSVSTIDKVNGTIPCKVLTLVLVE